MLYKIIEKTYKQIPLKYQQRLKDLQLGNLIQMRIEFQNGSALKILNYEIISNVIKLTQVNFPYYQPSTVVKEMIRLFLKFETLPIYPIIYYISTQQLLQAEYFIGIYTITCLVMDIFINLLIFIKVQKVRQKFENKINKQKCLIFTNVQEQKQNLSKSISWEELKIGQIVILQKGEYCPADLLILEASQQSIDVEFCHKFPCSCTFINESSKTKGSLSKFLTNLNGWVQFSSFSHGTIKLKNDPKITQFNKDNIIYKGQRLTQTDWMFGLVLQVGHACFQQRDRYYNSNYINQYSFYISIIYVLIFGILLIPRLILDSQLIIDRYQSSIAIWILFYPQNYFWINSLWHLIQLLLTKNPKQKNQQNQDHHINVLQEWDKKVLVSFQKMIYSEPNSPLFASNLKKNPTQYFTEQGFYSLSNQSYLELLKTDVIMIEQPEKLQQTDLRVSLLIHEKNKYYFNYDKLQTIIEGITPSSKINYEKLLLDTGRYHLQDEQKTLDVEMLLQEKQVPILRINEDRPKQKSIFLKEMKEMKESKELKKSSTDQKQGQHTSLRKQSARNLFQSQNNLASQVFSNGSFSSPQIIKQSSTHNLLQSNVINQKSMSASQRNINEQSNDQIMGDIYNEADFVTKLFDKQDLIYNEILIAILLCNNIVSVYDTKNQTILHHYANKDDEQIIEFAKKVDYKLICSTQIDNFKVEYKSDKIIKKAISISNTIKVFDIIALIEETINRKKTISVLVKDPESFELEEGALLYTRVEVNDKNDKDIKFHSVNDQIEELFWDGAKGFVYYKQQLNYSKTEQFLNNLNSINETYGNRDEELDKLFLQLERNSQPFFIIGLKQNLKIDCVMGSQSFQTNSLRKQHIYSTLIKFQYKVCFITNTYEDLIRYIRTYHVVERNSIVSFFDVNTLHFQVRQMIQDLIEKQNLFENYQLQKPCENYILLNSDTLDAIVKDEYLKYHFVVLFYVADGLGIYGIDEKQKGKLLKLIQITERHILSIGHSLDNSFFYYKSDCSMSINSDDPLCALSNPNYLLTNFKQAFQMLFYFTPQKILALHYLIEVQLYRCCQLAFALYLIDYSTLACELYTLIIMFLVPSNILTCAIHYNIFHNQIKYEKANLNIYRNHLLIIKNNNIYYQLIRISFLGLLDGFIIYISWYAFINLHLDQPVNYSLFFYVILEFVEKLRYFIQDFQLLNHKFSIIIFAIILPFIFGLITENIRYQLQEINFIIWLFMCIFSITISFVLQISFEISDFCFTNPFSIQLNLKNQLEIEKINSNLKFLVQKSNNNAKLFVEKLFEGKEFIDEQLLKAIKGDQKMVDQMDKDLKFTDNNTEKAYLSFVKQPYYYQYIIYEIIILAIRLYEQINDLTLQYLIIAVLQCVIISIFSFLKISKFRPLLLILLRFIFFIVLHSIVITDLISTELFVLAFAIIHHPQIGIYPFYLLTLLSIIMDIVMTGIFKNGDVYHILKHAFILIEIGVPLLLQAYKTEFLSRYQYVLQNRLLEEYKQLNDALGLLMPRFIKERMTKGQIQISEDQGDVAILFCDIYEFDEVIRVEQVQVVEFLDNLYRQFDQFCSANELQKIETVGKTYMAAGGLKDYNISSNKNSTERILDTAIQMIDTVKTMKYGNNQSIVLKIGIHYGRVIAGVIGAHKPQFSLIGDTVNTTSRVCSTSEPGIITLSEEAYEKVIHLKFQFQLRKVEAKGKGTINTYQLLKSSNKKKSIIRKDNAKSPAQTPKVILKQVQDNLRGKKKMTIIQKVQYGEEKDSNQQNPLTIQNTLANAQLINQQQNNLDLQQIPSVRPSSRSIYNSACKLNIQLVTPNDELGKFDGITTPKNNNNQPTLNNIEGIKASIPFGGLGGYINKKRVVDLAQEINQFGNNNTKRKSIYKRSGTKNCIAPECDSILAMPIGGARLSESVKIDFHRPSLANKVVKNLEPIEQSISVQKSPCNNKQSEKQDELEIRKLQYILDLQSYQDIQVIEEKLDTEYQGISESNYKDENHQLYYSIYEQYRDQEKQQLKYCIIFIIIVLIAKNILYFLLNGLNSQAIIILVCQTVFSIILGGIIYYLQSIIILKLFVIIYYLIYCILDILLIHYNNEEFEIIYQVCQIVSVYINIFFLQAFTQNERIKLTCVCVILLLITLLYQQYIFEIILYCLCIASISLIAHYQEIKILAENYQCFSKYQIKNAKQTQILQYLLPQHIIGRFFQIDTNASDSFTDVFEDCTILFADIAGFTKYSSSVEPEQVVNMLRLLFQQFDEACQRCQVYKLFTIGDCYVCIGIIDANNRDPIGEAINVVLFGLKMIQIIQQINKDPQFQHLNMRIGAHTGRVIGGVVGTDVVRYDIYGEDVTIANKMESNGTIGKIMVSEATKNLIESDPDSVDIFEFEYAQDVLLPQRNTSISTYFVQFESQINQE